ncbi:MAG TPA: TonB-dependent receptor [Parvularcula sp.]|nr:TonB-dependent receptor [Parvularcula sp.]HBS33138.1 TonB-dependent receptor [Parvularcula sp.]HBS34236.1 TonB-dependent receptor [Parvularcula sp.]
MKKAFGNSTSVVVAVILMGAPAFAQVDEIVVTSQRVEQNLQAVPIAVTALSGDQLLDATVVNLEDLNQIVPSLNFRKGTTNANSAVFLRGVGTISFSIAAEPSVSTVVDGVVLSRSGQAFADLYDIERVEVLRGPQGTLFGKNASAGVVSIVTKGGTDELEGEINLGLWEESEYRAKGSVAGPLTDTLSARLTGFYGYFDGHITNIFNGGDERVNGYERWGSRFVLDFDPSDAASVRLAVDFARSDDDCCAEITGVSRGPVLDAELGFPTARGEDQRVVNHNLVTTTEDTTWGASLQGDFTMFSDHTLTMIGAYRNWENVEVREGDFLPRAIVGTAQLHDRGIVETDQYSFEARLASPQDQTVSYVLGGFVWRSDNTQFFLRDDITCATSTLPVAPSGATPCDVTDTVNTIFPTANSFSDVEMTNYAFFGNATWNLTDAFRMIGGVRWTRDDVEFTHERAPGVNLATGLPATGPGVSGNPAGGLTSATPPGNGTNISAGETDNSNFSGRVIAQYDFTDGVMGYASYSRGYKGPAFNVFFNHTAPTNSVPIGAETSNSYEAGFKSRMFDDRLQLNVAGFYAVYDGFQANNFVLLNGTIITNLTNAGKVSTAGFEVDGVFTPTDWWTVTGGVAYTDAEVKAFNPNPLTNAPSALNETRLPLAPRWSSSIVSEWTAPFFMGTQAHLRGAWSYQGDQFSDLGNGGPIEQHSLVDLSLGFSDADDNYRLTFHVNNLLDDSYVTLNTSNGQRLHIPRDASRYVGVTLRANFN